MHVMNNLIRSATRTDGQTLKCLSFCRENEKFLSLFEGVNCEIYVMEKEGLSSWKEGISALPSNAFLINGDTNQFKDTYIDCVLVNDKLQEFDLGFQLSRQLHVPMILADHAGEEQIQKNPFGISPNINPEIMSRSGHINITIGSAVQSKSAANPQSIRMTIEPYIDSEMYSPDEKTIPLAIDNNTPPDLFHTVMKFASKSGAVGLFDNEDKKSHEITNSSKVFIATWAGMDIKALEAMSSGCIVIAPDSPDVRGIIKHGETGFLYKTIDELHDLLAESLGIEGQDIGNAARQVVLDKYSDKSSFTNKWNQVFSYISKVVFKL
tara:strand:+ start:1305 stop:2273 length:969 start_codon:yes stop_codon:yes gene_type:complete